MTAIALVVAAVVLLCFEATRLIGAAGIVLLIVFFLLMTLAMLLIAGVVFSFISKGAYERMKSHNYVMDSIEAVLNWEISEDAFPYAVASQAAFLAGCRSD